MAGHPVEQGVGAYLVGGIQQYEILLLVGVKLEFQLLSVGCRRGVVAQTDIPQHSAHIAGSGLQLLPLSQPFEVGRGVGRQVGVGIFLQHLHQSGLEALAVVVGHLCQSFQEHEFRHQRRHRELFAHLGIERVHLSVVVAEICFEGLVVELILLLHHAAQRPDVVGIAHGLPVGRLGEVGQNQIAVIFGFGRVPLTHIHQVHVVVSIQPVDIVGITSQQTLEFAL